MLKASLNTAIALSAIAYLTGIARLIMEIRFVPEIADAMPADQPGQAALVMLPFLALFGGWLWTLLAAAQNRPGGLIATLIFNLILAFPWGLATIISFCPTPCATAWPLVEIVTWSNVITGIIAASAIGLYMTAKSQPAAA